IQPESAREGQLLTELLGNVKFGRPPEIPGGLPNSAAEFEHQGKCGTPLVYAISDQAAISLSLSREIRFKDA
ncbi:MAG: hypothetical protein ACR2IV_18500, partial [Bryobacteraceae bacterium]